MVDSWAHSFKMNQIHLIRLAFSPNGVKGESTTKEHTQLGSPEQRAESISQGITIVSLVFLRCLDTRNKINTPVKYFLFAWYAYAHSYRKRWLI